LSNLSEENIEIELEARLNRIRNRLADSAAGKDVEKVSGHLRNRLRKNAEGRPEFIDRILTWFPEDTVTVSYSPRGDGKEFRSIQQGSAGQRAAAMLAFLLAYGKEPIVVDQPEDDLDNHLIYQLVVRQMRANKQRRQIIAVTHNPNIVVNGDAEMVYALDFHKGQCRVMEKGSLQDVAVREEICRVMEGGSEAFEERYRRLGNGGRHV
jgi:ABC-type glutathione transport system ATPase component